MFKLNVTKPKRIWYRNKEKIIDTLMLVAMSIIVLTLILVTVVGR
jgi:hypothetical protein